jgi:hypothetical protein
MDVDMGDRFHVDGEWVEPADNARGGAHGPARRMSHDLMALLEVASLCRPGRHARRRGGDVQGGLPAVVTFTYVEVARQFPFSNR